MLIKNGSHSIIEYGKRDIGMTQHFCFHEDGNQPESGFAVETANEAPDDLVDVRETDNTAGKINASTPTP